MQHRRGFPRSWYIQTALFSNSSKYKMKLKISTFSLVSKSPILQNSHNQNLYCSTSFFQIILISSESSEQQQKTPTKTGKSAVTSKLAKKFILEGLKDLAIWHTEKSRALELCGSNQMLSFSNIVSWEITNLETNIDCMHRTKSVKCTPLIVGKETHVKHSVMPWAERLDLMLVCFVIVPLRMCIC